MCFSPALLNICIVSHQAGFVLKPILPFGRELFLMYLLQLFTLLSNGLKAT